MRGINGIIRLLMMFGPMIFNQVRRFQRSRQQQIPRSAAPRPQRRQTQAPVQQQEELQYEEELPSEDDFVEPINK